MELEDNTVTKPNPILAYEPLMELCETGIQKELCPVCFIINQSYPQMLTFMTFLD